MTASVEAGGSIRFQLVYAAAHLGGFLCFLPLISLLLPQRAAQLTPLDSVTTLSWVLLAGGIASSIANIAAGWLSDHKADSRYGRFPMITIGLLATMFSFAGLAMAGSRAQLIIAFIAFQCAFNLMFAPMIALASDHVAERDKGRLFGWMSLATPLAQLAVLALAWWPVDDLVLRLALIGGVATILIAPLILMGPRIAGDRVADGLSLPDAAAALPSVRDLALAWISRFCIQCGGVSVSAYLFVHLTGLGAGGLDGRPVSTIFGALVLVSIAGMAIAGWLAGDWSDRSGRRLPFLRGTALLVAAGCVVMALASHWYWLALGYACFTIGLASFLTIDGAMIAQIVGRGGLRGTWLGIVNLTNTIPAIVVPAISLTLGTMTGATTTALLLCVAGAAVASQWCIAQVRTIR